MQRKSRTTSSFKAGMYLLETLTSGMYNEPLSIYREYIQNSVDSIDIARQKRSKTKFSINIDLDPFEKRIAISDNGVGLSSKISEQILSSIGSSEKTNNDFRGFRGIGRLGGLAFSEKATFQTKAWGEAIESVQEWDCKKLEKYLSDSSSSKMTLEQLFRRTTTFSKQNSKTESGSYFNVILDGVSSFRNYIFDIKKVREYLFQVAPLPFDSDVCSYGADINSYLSNNLSSYYDYEIFLNGEKLYKPYKDEVATTKKGHDRIEKVNLFEIMVKGVSVAYGWYGDRKELLGAITKGDMSSGIRVRVGNLLLGDSHLLDGCFREPRFNGYMIGEIHVDSPDLIPNSRRDDFVDNETKTLFYDAVEREIGLTISKRIRLQSRLKSKTFSSSDNLMQEQSTKCKSSPRNLRDTKIQTEKKSNQDKSTDSILDEIKKTCSGCPQFSKLSSHINKLTK